MLAQKSGAVSKLKVSALSNRALFMAGEVREMAAGSQLCGRKRRRCGQASDAMDSAVTPRSLCQSREVSPESSDKLAEFKQDEEEDKAGAAEAMARISRRSGASR